VLQSVERETITVDKYDNHIIIVKMMFVLVASIALQRETKSTTPILLP